MSFNSFIMKPLQGKTSVSRVFWLYGVLGSLVYGSLEFLFDPGNAVLMGLYEVGGLVFTVYVTVGTYRCAVNCRSARMANFVRVSAVITLLLLPVIMYLDLTMGLGV
jgi:succinate dehydrogenase hydrophobic anchor subunit